MTEVFKTILIMSLIGFCSTAVLLAVKPIAVKRFPAKWQYFAWVTVMITMVVPFYKLIPEKEAQRISFVAPSVMIMPEIYQEEENVPTVYEEKEVQKTFDLVSLAVFVWLSGTGLYMAVVLGSYMCYIIKRRKNSAEIKNNTVLNRARAEKKIRRRIRLKMSADIKSPALVGVMFPVIYIPCREINEENLRMVFLHELTHYKRKDLLIKWLAVFVNAVHWFNPLAYLMVKNIGEACEMACDMAVTHNMAEEEQKIYMKTIIDLA